MSFSASGTLVELRNILSTLILACSLELRAKTCEKYDFPAPKIPSAKYFYADSRKGMTPETATFT